MPNNKMGPFRLTCFLVVFSAIMQGFYSAAFARLPDTMKVKVTFYDFNPNSDFGSGTCGNAQGMVQDLLDKDRKPVLKAVTCFDDHLNKWFRPSGGTGAQFDPMKNRWTGLVNYKSRPYEWIGTAFVPYPTDSFANIVMYDSLPFVLIDSASGEYQFARPLQNQFWWIDNRGFHADNPGMAAHNEFFTMEIHQRFTYKGGETFRFEGDDDVWVFVNGKLALDIGGMNAQSAKTLSLDQEAARLGIALNGTYWFDFFYCERSGKQSTNTITTNILKPQPNIIYVKPDSLSFNPNSTHPSLTDTILHAGDSLHIFAFIIDDTSGIREEWSDIINWQVIDAAGNPIQNTNFTGNSSTFFFTEANTTVTIKLTFKNPDDSTKIITTTITIHVQPGAADHIIIEASADSTVSPRNDNPLNTLILGVADTTKPVYAVLRDRYGNWVSCSKATSWASTAQTVATVLGGSQALGQGLVTKQSNGTSLVIATNTQLTLGLIKRIDTVAVIVDPFATDTLYDSLRICARTPAGLVPIAQLIIGVGDDTTLVVQGLRQKDKVWIEVAGTWTGSGGLKTTIFPPINNSNWLFIPTNVGNFGVSVSYAGRYFASIPVTVKAGPPVKILLYPAAGIPDVGSNVSYPSIPIVVSGSAGTALPLYAKAFDSFGFWNSDYETSAALTALFSWTVHNVANGLPDSALGTLEKTVGNPDKFTPVKAYASADIIVTFRSGTQVLKDTVRVSIAPGARHHLVIEATPNLQVSPNRDNPVDTIRLSTTYKPSDSVYAVVRDKYGNFVGYSTATAWQSGAAAVTAAARTQDSGQGILSAVSAGIATVTARNQQTPTLVDPSDDVVVIVQDYWYDSLRILNVDKAQLEQVVMPSNRDTLLLVQGRRIDNGVWETITADWQIIDQQLVNTLSDPPRHSTQWFISPTGIASGRVRVTLGMDNITVPDTVLLDFKAAPPISANISFITPPENRKAGDTMLLLVEVRNEDGLIPGRYCYPADASGALAAYQDTLGTGGRPDPRIINSQGSAIITQKGTTGNQMGECFIGGIDTIKVVMYYAPSAADSLHKIFLNLGSLSAATDPFRLLPGKADSIILMRGGLPIGESISLTAPKDSLVLYAIGYDQWKNPIPSSKLPVLWTVDGSLHPVADSLKNTSILTYITKFSTSDELGYITVISGGLVDSVKVLILGSVKRLIAATTRDTNGNGYLDCIELNFSSLVTLANLSASNISINHNGVALPVAGVEGNAARLDRNFRLNLAESAPGTPQTAWQPLVTVKKFSPISDTSIRAHDGAGPVAWKVFDYAAFPPSAPYDTLRVALSEEVKCEEIISAAVGNSYRYYDGKSGYNAAALSAAVFGGSCAIPFSSDYTILVPTGSFTIVPGEDSLQLTGPTFDTAGNKPPSPGIARRAVIEAAPGHTIMITIGPINPFNPSADLRSTPQWSLISQFYSDIIGTNTSGTIISLTSRTTLEVQSDGSYGRLTIFDAVGNVVQNIPIKKAKTTKDYGAFWDGKNKNGRYVGNGGYLALASVRPSGAKKSEKYKVKIGVKR